MGGSILTQSDAPVRLFMKVLIALLEHIFCRLTRVIIYIKAKHNKCDLGTVIDKEKEYFSRMSTLLAVVVCGVTALWFLFNWFYLRPKQIKKQEAKLNEIIAKFEDIQGQLNNG